MVKYETNFERFVKAVSVTDKRTPDQILNKEEIVLYTGVKVSTGLNSIFRAFDEVSSMGVKVQYCDMGDLSLIHI